MVGKKHRIEHKFAWSIQGEEKKEENRRRKESIKRKNFWIQYFHAFKTSEKFLHFLITLFFSYLFSFSFLLSSFHHFLLEIERGRWKREKSGRWRKKIITGGRFWMEEKNLPPGREEPFLTERERERERRIEEKERKDEESEYNRWV